jgi:hypothetical protein
MSLLWKQPRPVGQMATDRAVHKELLAATTKKTPYNMILGYTPTAHQPLRETDIPTLDKRIDDVRSARKQAQEAMSKAQEGLIKATKFKGYEEGGKVWLEGTNIKRPYDSPKLSPR